MFLLLTGTREMGRGFSLLGKYWQFGMLSRFDDEDSEEWDLIRFAHSFLGSTCSTSTRPDIFYRINR